MLSNSLCTQPLAFKKPATLTQNQGTCQKAEVADTDQAGHSLAQERKHPNTCPLAVTLTEEPPSFAADPI